MCLYPSRNRFTNLTPASGFVLSKNSFKLKVSRPALPFVSSLSFRFSLTVHFSPFLPISPSSYSYCNHGKPSTWRRTQVSKQGSVPIKKSQMLTHKQRSPGKRFPAPLETRSGSWEASCYCTHRETALRPRIDSERWFLSPGRYVFLFLWWGNLPHHETRRNRHDYKY